VKKRCLWIIALIFCLLLTACGEEPLPTPPPATVNAVQTEPAETVPETTLPEETEPAETMPEHSSLYLPDIPVEDVILYFNEVVLDSEFAIEGNKASSIYMMLSPVLSSCTDELVQEKVLDIAATLTFADVVGDITADQLGEYGFTNPTRFELGDVEGNVIDLVVGGAATAGQSYVVMGEQYDSFMNGETDELMVLRYSSEAFNCIEVEYTTLLNRAIWIQDIHSVESIVYDMAGEVYTLKLEEYDDVTGSGVDVVRTVGTLNEKEVNETNTKRLFSRTLNLREVGELNREIELGEPEYTITLNLRDGSSRTLELIKLNERQYACRVDGKAEFYIYKSNIQTLMTAITRIMDDRNVSLVYTT